VTELERAPAPAAAPAAVTARRTAYAFFYLEDGGFFDLDQLLRGVVKVQHVSRVLAMSILDGREHALALTDLELLARIPSDRWVPVDGVESERVRELGAKGLVLLDGEEFAEFRRREETLATHDWNVYAALYHFLTKWEDVHLKIEMPPDPSSVDEGYLLGELYHETLRDVVARYGLPPTHFPHVPDPLAVQPLPLVDASGGLFETLAKRKTTRLFDDDRPVPLEQFSTVLYATFGGHGSYYVAPDIYAIKRTSPSGGGLHPVEAYPLVLNVDGVEPGLYHYSVEDHSLELMEGLDAAEARELANEFTSGQSYPRTAGALVVMTARFYRNFWKYRRHDKAYSVLLMDAAHLSQTLYLVCAELGLGAFVTAAINNVNIERRFGFDAYVEAPILISGFGVPAADDLGWEPEFQPYRPRETKL
jgi:putative peptide maturation dehydrogenase